MLFNYCFFSVWLSITLVQTLHLNLQSVGSLNGKEHFCMSFLTYEVISTPTMLLVSLPNRTLSFVFLVTEACHENKDATGQSLYRFSNRNLKGLRSKINVGICELSEK